MYIKPADRRSIEDNKMGSSAITVMESKSGRINTSHSMIKAGPVGDAERAITT